MLNSLVNGSNLQTVVLLVATIGIITYSVLFEHPEDVVIEDLLDYEAIEQELESANPVRILPYKSPFDERLFVPWPPGVSYDPFAEKFSLNSFLQELASQRSSCVNRSKTKERSNKFAQIWRSADNMITRKGLWSPDDKRFARVLDALNTACLTKVDVLDIGEYESGTADKWIGTLEGGQKVVIKIVWEGKGDMKHGGLCNDGYEMPTSEIAAFHLHKILGFHNVPFVTGRSFDLLKDILPNASPEVARRIKVIDTLAGKECCVKGLCQYCALNHTMCPRDNIIETSVTYWIRRKLKLHTFPKGYMPFSNARSDRWERVGFNDKSYCNEVRNTLPPYSDNKLYLDLFDFSVLDTLMHHFDSKHYTINDDSPAHGLTVRLDHGRAFCSYHTFEEEIFLAPIKQCCTLRRSTYDNLLKLRDGKLSRLLRTSLAFDPISPILKSAWFPVLEKRLQIILELMEKCFKANGAENVLA